MIRYVWVIVRVAIIAFWVFAGISVSGPPLYSYPLEFALGALIWGCVATRFFVMGQYHSAGNKVPWLRPSWFVNPFQSFQPFQFFHVVACSFIAFALMMFVRRIFIQTNSTETGLPLELFVGGFGFGIYLGIQWAVFTYRKQFV
jgi:hypothetical protein